MSDYYPDGVTTDQIPGFRKEDAEAEEKVKRFLRMYPEDQLEFWKANWDKYEETLHEYILNHRHQPVSWEQLARICYDSEPEADFYINSDWREDV